MGFILAFLSVVKQMLLAQLAGKAALQMNLM